MNALERLADMLAAGAGDTPPTIPPDRTIDKVIDRLQKHLRGAAGGAVPEDLQREAVIRFQKHHRFERLKDARLVSFGLSISPAKGEPAIIEDAQSFRAVLDKQTGIDQWLSNPRWYRRCYQGLVRSYFTYDPRSDKAPSVGRKNWSDLRDYLHDRTRFIVDGEINPDWVNTTLGNRKLFSDDPCSPYAKAVLEGDSGQIDVLRDQLGITDASWFFRELILAQVERAKTYSNQKFAELIPRLLDLLESKLTLRDRGLILILDHYVRITAPPLNQPLRDAAVRWWGNPWLESHEKRWGGVEPAAREMVAEWLKREFIEAFFSKLAEDGASDKRRVNFWLRYAKAMDHIQFALGSNALTSKDKDFKVLRDKMDGLYTELADTNGANNAFIMTMGNLVAVEFSGASNAFYGYNTRQQLPFDLSRPVVTRKDAKNSLKHSSGKRLIWMQHQDGIKGWNRWEDMFEATLREEFGIHPHTGPRKGESVGGTRSRASTSSGALALTPDPRTTAPPRDRTLNHIPKTFSMAAFRAFVAEKNLVEENLTDRNGNLWIRTDDRDLQVNAVLLDWKFTYRPGKGWWK